MPTQTKNLNRNTRAPMPVLAHRCAFLVACVALVALDASANATPRVKKTSKAKSTVPAVSVRPVSKSKAAGFAHNRTTAPKLSAAQKKTWHEISGRHANGQRPELIAVNRGSYFGISPAYGKMTGRIPTWREGQLIAIDAKTKKTTWTIDLEFGLERSSVALLGASREGTLVFSAHNTKDGRNVDHVVFGVKPNGAQSFEKAVSFAPKSITPLPSGATRIAGIAANGKSVRVEVRAGDGMPAN